MFRPFWGSDSLTKLTTFWGGSPTGVGRLQIAETAPVTRLSVDFGLRPPQLAVSPVMPKREAANRPLLQGLPLSYPDRHLELINLEQPAMEVHGSRKIHFMKFILNSKDPLGKCSFRNFSGKTPSLSSQIFKLVSEPWCCIFDC